MKDGPSSLTSSPKTKNNAHTLFAAVDKLACPPLSAAFDFPSVTACNEFASFFHWQILKKIRQAVSAFTPGTGYVLSTCPL